MSPRPNLFTLPAGAPFADAFADGFFHRYADLAPEDCTRITIMVNTTRAMRTIEEALADRAPVPGPLPRLVLMSELYADPLEQPDLPPAIPTLRRQLRLTRLVERFLTAKHIAGEAMAPLSAAADLAGSLALLIDQFHDEGLSADHLDTVLEASNLDADVARHWDQTLRFVDLVRQVWPQILAEEEGGAMDTRARQRAVVESLAAKWAETPPTHPVIVAASTGSVASTAMLIAAVARLPEGAVVLPGFDPQMDDSIWEATGPDHPMGPFRGLFERLDATPVDVRDWHETLASPRHALLAQALRPAPVTDHWHLAGPALRDGAMDATKGLSQVEAETPRHEADAIAIAIREAIDVPGRTVTLVTPDAVLSRRVTASLDQFGIRPDDTSGQPLAQTPPGILLRMIVRVAAGQTDPVALAGLLQHPLVRAGLPRRDHMRLARRYERTVLRKGYAPAAGPALPSWPEAEEPEAAWLTAVTAAIQPLVQAIRDNAPLTQAVAAHTAALEALTDEGNGKGPEAWEGDAGPELRQFLAQLSDQAGAYGPDPIPDYPALIDSLLRGAQVRPKPRQPHPRVSIIGPREARLESADLVILAGLNDGAWPEPADPGPWLSRPMCAAIGLPLPERSVGLSAHDFLCAASRPRAILTRSRKAEGAATVPSRWLIRLETLLKGIGAEDAWQQMQERGNRLTGIAAYLAMPDQPTPRAARPAPSPPVEARPRKLPVTGIETLIRDAYAIYARYVLRLRPLDPLGRAPDARDRGTVMHKVLEAFVARTPDWPGRADAAPLFQAIADEVLAAEVPWPDLRRAWRARIARFADWFLDAEDARRAVGHPLAWEVNGALTRALPEGPFEITAQADRIDLLNDGTGAVYDYKTGDPPSEKEVNVRFNHQLHVQAAILAEGGFRDVPALEASTGAYIGLTGRGAGGKQVSRDGLADEVAEHMQAVDRLLAAYDAGAPYLSRGRPQKIAFEGDYDHLARLGEWDREEDT